MVEDLAMVLVLVLLPALAPLLGAAPAGAAPDVGLRLLRTLAEVGAFVAFMLIVGRRLFPHLL